MSVVAVAALVVSGWLGGQLVHVLGVTQPHHGEAESLDRDRLHPPARDELLRHEVPY